MTYQLGRRSVKELIGVHPQLVELVRRAIKVSDQDFSVIDGLRIIEEQREYVARGVSQTLKSKHLPQPDGYGHAVDLVPYINGRARWELEPCYVIARAVREAARELGVKIRWGGAWQRLDTNCRAPGLMVEEYVSKRRRQGRSAFIDAPHYELVP